MRVGTIALTTQCIYNSNDGGKRTITMQPSAGTSTSSDIVIELGPLANPGFAEQQEFTMTVSGSLTGSALARVIYTPLTLSQATLAIGS
jgi:hypothetical protein